MNTSLSTFMKVAATALIIALLVLGTAAKMIKTEATSKYETSSTGVVAPAQNNIGTTTYGN